MSNLVAIHGSHRARWVEADDWDKDGGFACFVCGASELKPGSLEKPCAPPITESEGEEAGHEHHHG